MSQPPRSIDLGGWVNALVKSTESRAAGSWLYVFPCAPLSLNHAYIETPTGQRVKKPETIEFEDFLLACLEAQDLERGKPSFKEYRCEWLLLYPPEDFFSAQAPKRTRQFHPDPRFQRIDLSNAVKLAEDVLFGYFGVGDERVVDLTVSKRAVAELPVPFVHYSEHVDRLRKGNIVVLLSEATTRCPDWERSSALDFVAEPNGVVGSEFPSWFSETVVTSNLLDLSADVRVHREMRVRDRFAALAWRNGMKSTRARHAGPWLGLPLRDVFQARAVMRRRYRVFERGSGEFDAWYAHPARAADLLLFEGEQRALSRAETLAALPLPPKARVLIYPGGVGSWVFPFLREGVRSVTIADQSRALDFSEARLLRSLGGEVENLYFKAVDNVTGIASLGHFDAIVCLDYLDLLSDPIPLLDALSDVLNPGGKLILSYTYKCKAAGESFPWIRAGKIGAKSVREVVQSHLTKRSGLGLDVCDGSSFRDDLRILERLARKR